MLSPHGDIPLTAKFKTAPALKKSDEYVTLSPFICSGDNQAGEPAINPVEVSEVASEVWAIPKSIIFGPESEIRILEGLISR